MIYLFKLLKIFPFLISPVSFLLASFESLTSLPELLGYIFVFVFGTAIGSFLNVVIHRVPNEESVIFPNSTCSNLLGNFFCVFLHFLRLN